MKKLYFSTLFLFYFSACAAFAQKAKQNIANQTQNNAVYDSSFLQGLQYRLAGLYCG